MRIRTLRILIRQVWNHTMKNRSTFWLIGIFNVLLLSSLLSGYQYMHDQHHLAHENSEEVRERWVNNPDKHPHRMAHYGYVAFRQRYPLSFFDFGMDSYVGNVVFLEAHRQNTVNFSAASLTNGLLRLGEISAGMILQLLVPLLLFFWGFQLIAKEREQGTLKILFMQGASGRELIIGKSLGLFSLSLTIILPAIIIGGILLTFNYLSEQHAEAYLRFFLLSLSYLFYFLLLSTLAVLVSAGSSSSRSALIQLIGYWLLFTLVLPKVSQVIGQSLYPAPSKIEFDVAVEEELIKQGDSHNPNDPHYQALKDSLLTKYGVESTDDLPFNYSGFVMREGERLSAETFNRHQSQLVSIFLQQQRVIRLTAAFNPYLAIKNLSMALSGTDYMAFNDFQQQTETYRYDLAQHMNNLQIKHIANTVSSSAEKGAVISKSYWENTPDFEHQSLPLATVIRHELLSFLSLLLWLGGMAFLALTYSNRIKVI